MTRSRHAADTQPTRSRHADDPQPALSSSGPRRSYLMMRDSLLIQTLEQNLHTRVRVRAARRAARRAALREEELVTGLASARSLKVPLLPMSLR
ncbi:hypothetical protein EYF80_057737 [Liparis tanakae]|uniref:Uncharacterized protein n=1 Tax=Liparis tanakae TaxID=230148 RepID=A0A4Z2EUQ9_9TELE|nr:hypothetical protein EYF80_057737 [Liparis tanakae]